MTYTADHYVLVRHLIWHTFTVNWDIFSLLYIIAASRDVLLTIFTSAPRGREVISCLRGEAAPISAPRRAPFEYVMSTT